MNTLYSASRARVLGVLAGLALIATAVFAVSAQAARPMPDGCISLTSCSGSEAGAARAAEPAVPFGSTVAFDHSMSGKMAKKYTLGIQVTCRQGNTPVYNWFGQVDYQFTLASPPGDIYEWTGGDAFCTAFLHYSTRSRRAIVAMTTFDVTG